MKKFFTLLLFIGITVFGQSGNGHSPDLTLSFTPTPYSVAPKMRQGNSSTDWAKSSISNADATDLYVNFIFDTGGKSVYLVYTTNGSNPSKSNGTVVSCSFSTYSDPNRTWYGQIPSSVNIAGSTINYIFYISDGSLASSWGRVAGDGYQTSWSEGNSTISYTVRYSSSIAGGNWSDNSSWTNSANPGSSSTTEIELRSAVTLDADKTVKLLQINPNGSFDCSSNILTIATSGSLNNNNIFTPSTGKVVFSGSGTVTGTITLNNVEIAGGVNFGTGSTIIGTLQINGGGYVNTNAPTYGSSSILKYNVNATYDRYQEWLSNSGRGIPYNVQLSNNTTLNLASNGGNADARSILGSLTIDVGSSLRMKDNTNTGMSATLTVTGNVTNNGTLELSPASGGDIIIGGNFTQNGTFTHNSRTVTFNGTTQQTLDGSGSLDFHTVSITNSVSGVVLSKGITASNSATVSGILDCATFSVSGGGTFTLNSSATLKLGSLTGVNGNITTTTKSLSTGANYVFNGSAAQVMGSDLPSTVNSLEVNNSAGVSLSGALALSSGLTLTSGLLDIGNFDLSMGSSSLTGGSATSYVKTSGTGILSRTIGAATETTFPIGYNAYNPVYITNAVSKLFSVRAKSGFTGATPIDATKIVQAYWEVTPEDLTSVNATLKFQWNASQHAGSFVIANGVEIGRVFASDWAPKTATLAGSDPYTATATGFTSFSEFGVGNPGSLPVELTSFNGALRNGIVDLKWETKTEVNNYGFEVERKSATADWSKIGFVEGHGSTNSPKYYSYSDKPSGTGKFSYRLKQIDNDGAFEYSPVVEVLVDNLPNGFVLEQNYPNPFNPETSIRFALKEDTKASLKVFNAMGEEVATLFDGIAEAGRYYDVKFSGNDLSSGFYIYKLVAGDYVSVKKMLLMK